MKFLLVWFLTPALLFTGCAALGQVDAPPEYHQKVLLRVHDDYVMHQAPSSTYDVGDLQSFHTQHTLPITVEETFKEIFGQVEMMDDSAGIETGAPDVPAIFEVRLIDLANDISQEAADDYRAQLTLAVAMKSPRDHIFWQQTFRGDGYVRVDPQFSTGLGPNDAVVDALRDALDQMQQAILHSPEVRNQMLHYKESDLARRREDVKI